MKHTFYHRNEKLKTIKTGWAGNAIRKGKYQNIEHGHHGIKNIFKMKFSSSDTKSPKLTSIKWDPEINKVRNLTHVNEDSLIWLGHNSFFMQLGGKRIMFDPVFGNIPFVKRQSAFPANPKIFKDIDYTLLSHDHYDHLDKKSLKVLAIHNPHMKIICGLGLKELLEKWMPETIKIIEAGWYQQLSENGIKITFLPCKHWGKRGATDTSKRLWGAYMVQSDKLSVYYSGDTGFGEHFNEIAELFGKPDYALIGIGAYKPRWFMKPNHISPQEAVDAAKIMGAKTTIPMHYGTFKLSQEPMFDPPKVFGEEADKKNINHHIPLLGEVVKL